MLLRLGKSTVAVLEGLSRHPGYASMRAKHLALLRMVALTEDGNANPSAQTCHPTFQFSTGSLSQRFFDFRFLNNWEEVQAVVDRLGPELSPVHLEAAYSRVKSLKLIPSTEFMDELANRSISLSHCMSARNISSILHACAKLQYNNPEMVETLAQTMLSEGQISKLDCLDMASIVFALGALNQLKHAEDRGERSKKQQEREGIPMVFASEKEFTQEVVAQLCSGEYFETFNEQQLAGVISGLTKLKCQDPSAQEALAKIFLKPGYISAMKFFDLASLWGNLGQMGFKQKEALDALAQEIMKPSRLAGFKPLELSYIMHGSGLHIYWDKVFLDAVLSEVTKEDRLLGFREKELANIIYAVGNLNIRDKHVIDKLLEEAMRVERLGLFTEQGLSNVVFAMRRLGYGSDPRLERLLKESKEHLPSTSNISDSQLLATVFGAKTTVDDDDVSKVLIKQILDPDRIKLFSHESLSGILNGLHQIGYSDPEGLDICLREVKTRLAVVDAHILGYFAYGFRVNKINDQEMLDALAQEIVKPHRLAQISAQGLIGIFHTLCLNGWCQRDLVRTIINEVQSPERLSNCPESSLASVLNGLSEIGYVPREAELIPLLEEVARPERLASFPDRALASIVVSCAKLKCAPRELAIRPLAELCAPGRLVKLKRSEVAQAIYNLGQLRYRNDRVVTAAVKEMLKPDRLQQFKRIELSMLVYGLGLLKLRDQDATTALASQVVLPGVLENFKNHELANIVHGFGNMKLQCSDIVEKLSSEAVREERVKKYKHGEISNIFYGLCTFPAKIVSSAAQSVFTEMMSRSLLRMSSGAQIAQVALGVGNLGVKGFSGAHYILEEALKSDRLAGYKAFELSHICYFVGQLGVTDPDAIDRIVNEVMRPNRIPSMSQNELSVVSRNLALVACKTNKVFSAISEEMMKRFFKELSDMDAKSATG